MYLEKVDLYSYFGIKKEEGAKGYLNIYRLDEIFPGRKRPE